MAQHDGLHNPSARPSNPATEDGSKSPIAGYLTLRDDSGNPREFAVLPVAGRSPKDGIPTVSWLIARAIDNHAEHARDLERALADADAYSDELRVERDDAIAEAQSQRELVASLQSRLEALNAELKEWRKRASVAEGQLLGAHLKQSEAADRDVDRDAEGDTERGAEPDAPGDEVVLGPDAATAGALEGEDGLADAQDKLARVTDNWLQAEAKCDSAWRRVGEIQAELDQFREQSIARSARQRRDAQLDMARAMEQASLKLVGVKEQLRRSEEQCQELKSKLAQAETDHAVLETRLAAVETARAELEAKMRNIGRTR
ncbi:MAG: hypothetical protein MJE77_27815 [Proteobacteria bacterium]|nr:hypothetical protein [Pseudomonadota bacterium]